LLRHSILIATQPVYLRAKKWIDRVAAGAITVLGLRLIFTAHKAGI
jgi:hypothetical protein